jgi:bifunctional DNase/RNase
MSERAVVETEVSALVVDEKAQSPVVVLREVGGKRTLPIWIGHAEASSIAMVLAGQPFERPLTHDLMRLIVEGLHATLEKVSVTELRSRTFFAQLVLKLDNEIVSIDARPSDSIALALRMGAPIFVAEELLTDSGEGEDGEGPEKLRDLLEGMDPEDFGSVSP